MKLHEMHEEEMFVLVAPDGDPQVTMLAEDLPGSFAIAKMMHKAGYSHSPESLIREGFRFLPVRVTITPIEADESIERLNLALSKPKGIKPKL